jgi:pyruvate ferredoxin oxidoreductase gamma subunit
MFNVRIHGRGGQGAVTAATMLSVAAFEEGHHAQAFPTFGSERTGAPVVAFCRIDEEPIRTHEPVTDPDALIISDPTLLHQVRLFEGVGPAAYVVLNTARSWEELGLAERVAASAADGWTTVPATEISRERLGRARPNTALLGAFAAATGAVRLDSLAEAIRRRFAGEVADANLACAAAAFAHVARAREVTRHA